jgi:glycosyltransferase involved in cell wall biosynthesis
MDGDALPVTVVIPAYRCAGTIERAVRSALAQEPPPAEVVVVDDASGDATGSLAAALGARVVVHDQNSGEGAARNTGMRTASHDWIAFLDGDDEWLPGHLATLWDARDGHVIVGSAALGCGERPEHHRVRGWGGPGARVLRGPADVVVPENKLTASSVLVSRDAALAAGGFRADMPRAADLDLWLRMLESGTGVALARVTALYHQHPGQVSVDRRPMDEATTQVIASYSDRDWCTAAVRRRHEGRVAWDTARARLAAGASKPATLARLAARLARPARALGVLEMLRDRRAVRRLTAMHAPGGAPLSSSSRDRA